MRWALPLGPLCRPPHAGPLPCTPQKGSISSPALCASLFDIYLGTDPVSKDAKATFGKSLAAVLKEDK